MITQDASSMEIKKEDVNIGKILLKRLVMLPIEIFILILGYSWILRASGGAIFKFEDMLRRITGFPDNIPQDPFFLLCFGLPILISVWSIVSEISSQGRKLSITPERIVRLFPRGRLSEIAIIDVANVQIRENIVDKSPIYSVVISNAENKFDYLVSVKAKVKFPMTIGSVPQPLRDIAEFVGKLSGKAVQDVNREGGISDFRTRPNL